MSISSPTSFGKAYDYDFDIMKIRDPVKDLAERNGWRFEQIILDHHHKQRMGQFSRHLGIRARGVREALFIEFHKTDDRAHLVNRSISRVTHPLGSLRILASIIPADLKIKQATMHVRTEHDQRLRSDVARFKDIYACLTHLANGYRFHCDRQAQKPPLVPDPSTLRRKARCHVSNVQA